MVTVFQKSLILYSYGTQQSLHFMFNNILQELQRTKGINISGYYIHKGIFFKIPVKTSVWFSQTVFFREPLTDEIETLVLYNSTNTLFASPEQIQNLAVQRAQQFKGWAEIVGAFTALLKLLPYNNTIKR